MGTVFASGPKTMHYPRLLTLAAIVGCGAALLHCGSSNDNGPSNHPDSSVGDGGSGSDAPTADAEGDATVADGGMDAAPIAILVCNQQACAPAQFCATVAGDTGDAGDAGDAAADATADAADAADASTDAAGEDAGSGADAAAVTQQCKNAVFANVCENTSGTVFTDTFSVDTDAGGIVGAALGSACQLPIATPAGGGPTNPDSGQPLTGIGNLCIIGGGGSGQPAVVYLDKNSLTDVVLRGVYDDAGVFDLRFTQVVGPGSPQDLASTVFTGQPVTTDYFLVELAVDPASGSLCFAVIGMNGEGTAAGGFWVASQFLANGAFRTSTKSWYVYHWASSTDGGPPSSADTFTLVASGP
jgi:hypothetical protein